VGRASRVGAVTSRAPCAQADIPRVPTVACILAALAAMNPPAEGGRSASAGPLRPKLEIVEQGVADRGGIETSTRVLPVDLRLPTGFGVVYRSPEADGRLMRGNGALFAVFPRSLYRRTGSGAIPLVPSGVVYSIGMPGGMDYPGGSLRDPGAPVAPPVAGKVDLRVRPKATAANPVAESPGQPRPGAPADQMPPISEAARAQPDAAPTQRAEPVVDLKLGPPMLVRE